MNRSILLALLLATAACSPAGPGNGSADSAQTPGTALGIVAASMDKNAAPGDDFFGYANGNWVKSTPIPEDRSSIGGFYIADQERERQTRELLTSILESKPADGSGEAMIANYYRAYLDTDSIDRAGMAPAKADLDAIGRIADKAQLSAAIGGTLRADTDPLNATNFRTENLFGVFVTQGLATPGETLPYLMQGGIGLPEREYYLSGDAKMAGLRGQYRAYIETVMKTAGVERRASTGPPCSAPRSSAMPRSSRPIIRAPSPSSPPWSSPSRSRTGRTGWPSTRSTSSRTCFPSRSATPASRSTAPPFPARPSSGRATNWP